jgi:hypothetical protein
MHSKKYQPNGQCPTNKIKLKGDLPQSPRAAYVDFISGFESPVSPEAKKQWVSPPAHEYPCEEDAPDEHVPYYDEDVDEYGDPHDLTEEDDWDSVNYSDDFDDEETNESAEDEEKMFTIIRDRKDLRLDNLRYCPECGSKAKINNPFPYCDECGWNSKVDLRRSFNEWY